jgi:xanthine/CO dehydrogenase XdhC/CoxF family maturation factor
MKDLQTIVGYLASRADSARGGVLATLVAVEGSSYRRAGARLFLTPAGARIGSISGGCLEEDVLARSRDVEKTGRAELVVYDTTSENDLIWGVGLGCHGIVRVLIEKMPPGPAWPGVLAANLGKRRPTELAVVWQASDPALLGTHLAEGLRTLPAGAAVFRQKIDPPPELVIFGAGDDAQPLARGAKEFGWRVTIADPRPAFVAAVRFPEADARVAAPANELVARISPGPSALVVVMTHHYVHDVPLLRDLLPRPLAYLGLLGPRKRAQKILSDLEAGGFAISADRRARLHAPVGLDIGAETHEEVALSILAEMRAALAGRDGRPLRDRPGPIHD